MFKIIFVLVINTYNSGITTIDFTNLQQCETAKELIKKLGKVGQPVKAVCIEKQIPIKKTKCAISNKTVPFIKNYTWSYPVAFECVEE